MQAEPDHLWTVAEDPRGWYVLGPDNNGVQVLAEPGQYYDTEDEAREAMLLIRASVEPDEDD